MSARPLIGDPGWLDARREAHVAGHLTDAELRAMTSVHYEIADGLADAERALDAEFAAAAVEYASLGLPVLALHAIRAGRCTCGKECASPGKHPRLKRGLKDASTDVAVVASWWGRWPGSNIGLRTGGGLVVVDVDVQHGGAGTLAAIEREHGKLPRTAEVLTGGGGRHLYFASGGRELRNSAGKLGAGVDVRGEGGYVVAPPSGHASGRPYKWARKLELDKLAEPPSWLLVEDDERRRNGPAPPIGDAIPEGRRDNTLASIAGTMRRRGMGEAEILAALRVTNRGRCKPPLTDEEVERIARSVGHYPAASRETNPAPRTLEATPVTEIRMRSIEWFEKPLWQRSAFTLLAGAKGAGKGTYLAGLAAKVSRAGGNVLFVSSEDSAEIDLKPRLVAAGAGADRCYVIQQHVRLPDDVDHLSQLAAGLGGVEMLVIDPVANHIGDRNSNSDAEVRDAIAPLNRLADELGCLLIGVRHPGKDRSRGALTSILGSTAWTDTPRAVVMIAADDEDPEIRHIQVVAGNRAPTSTAQAFRIDAVEVPGLDEPITVAIPLGESAKSVDELLANATDSKSGKARKLILNTLAEVAQMESDALDAHIAQTTGLAARTIRDIRMELNNEGLIRSVPTKDEYGKVTGWYVARTNAPAPAAAGGEEFPF